LQLSHLLTAFSHYPLRLDLRTDQADPAGSFRVVDREHGDLEVLRDGTSQYRVETRPRTLADFEPTCWWHRTSPASRFTLDLDHRHRWRGQDCRQAESGHQGEQRAHAHSGRGLLRVHAGSVTRGGDTTMRRG
jgi:arylamine N-acetyltransferase